MAVFAATDVSVVVNSVDLSDHCAQASLSVDVADLGTTAFGDLWDTRIGGLKSATVSFDFHQDFAASSVDATLWSALGTVIPVVLKPTSGSVSATNPSLSFDVLVTSVSPVASSVGDLATQSVSWPITGAVTRATS